MRLCFSNFTKLYHFTSPESCFEDKFPFLAFKTVENEFYLRLSRTGCQMLCLRATIHSYDLSKMCCFN